MELNKIHLSDCIDGLNALPGKCANLLICDPPYFKVKGEFDFVLTWEEWLDLHERLAMACRRVLADNGTLFIWGHAKRIAYQQVIFDKWFQLENSLVWHVYDRQTNKGVELFRCFAPVTERILMYSNGQEPGEWDMTGWERVKLDVANFQPLRDYFKALQEWLGATKKAFIDEIGQRADHCFRWGSTQWDLPTPDTYQDLIEKFNIDRWHSFREYEDLRHEYEDLRRPFNNSLKFTDVLRFSQEAHITFPL